MAKINAPKAFDKSLLDAALLKVAEPFVDYVNANFDQLVRALFNQLTFSDNLRGQVLTIKASHNTPLTLTASQDIGAILPLKCVGDAVTSFTFATTQNKQASATFTFLNPIPILSRSVSVSGGFSTYETSSNNFNLGDRVSFSGYGNKNNNGNFLISYKNANSLVVYNPNGATEAKITYTGSSELPKSVTLFVFYN